MIFVHFTAMFVYLVLQKYAKGDAACEMQSQVKTVHFESGYNNLA